MKPMPSSDDILLQVPKLICFDKVAVRKWVCSLKRKSPTSKKGLICPGAEGGEGGGGGLASSRMLAGAASRQGHEPSRRIYVGSLTSVAVESQASSKILCCCVVEPSADSEDAATLVAEKQGKRNLHQNSIFMALGPRARHIYENFEGG